MSEQTEKKEKISFDWLMFCPFIGQCRGRMQLINRLRKRNTV